MSYEEIQINQNTWRIEDMGVRFFLLTGTDRALLIDSGMTVNNAKDIAAGLTDLPISLLNTHADRDHIGSNEQFESFYMHPAEEPVYRRSGKQGNIIPIHEGDTLDLGQRKLFVIELPGHTPGSIAVLDTENRVLISGGIFRNLMRYGRHMRTSRSLRRRSKSSMTARRKSLQETYRESWKRCTGKASLRTIWAFVSCCVINKEGE